MSKVVKLSIEANRGGADRVADPAEDHDLVREGLDILAAFRSIADADVRRSLVTLTRALAGREPT